MMADQLRARAEAAERDAKDWLHAYKAASRDLSETEATLAAVRETYEEWKAYARRNGTGQGDDAFIERIDTILDGEGK